MNKNLVDKLIWIFIYAGLLAVCLSIFVHRTDTALAQWVGWGGGAVALLGVGLIVLRSYMQGD
jgi:hypothetical protein